MGEGLKRKDGWEECGEREKRGGGKGAERGWGLDDIFSFLL